MFGVELKDQLSELKSKHNDPNSARILFTSSKEGIIAMDGHPLTALWLFILLTSAVLVVLQKALVFHLKLPGVIFQSGGLKS